MAQQRRMIYGSIYANTELNLLPIEARHLYIGTLVLADDDGRLRADPRYLKGQFFSYDENISSTDVEKWLEMLTVAGQIQTYERDGIKVLKHPKWAKYQRIRTDMYVTSKLPNPLRNRNDDDTETVPNISKDKVSKDNITASLSYLKNLPKEDLKEFHERFDCYERQITRKAEDLVLWCETNAKTKKNYRAFLLTALRKDFDERPKKQAKVEEVKEEISPESLARIEAIKRETKGILMGKRVIETPI